MTPGDLTEKQLRLMSAEQRKALGVETHAEAEARAAHKSEREMQQMIRAFLDQKGWFYVWQRMDKRATGQKGQPDFVICVPMGHWCKIAHFAAIECKMPGATLSSEQRAALDVMARTGGLYIVATSAKQAIDWLLEITI